VCASDAKETDVRVKGVIIPLARGIFRSAPRGGIGAAGANEAVTDDDDGDVCA